MLSFGIICLLVLSGFFGILNFENDGVKAKTLYVGGSGGGNYKSIQKAIEAASTGDTVYVYAGTYKENVYINKTISLIGASWGNTTIDAQGSKNGIMVNANYVNISGFTVKNGGENTIYGGITLYQVKDCSIKNNNISSNGYYGIYIVGNNKNRENHRIENNIISFNKADGIKLTTYSSYNHIINNIIKNNCLTYANSNGGIQVFFYSNNNTISDNTIRNNNKYGIFCYYAKYNLIKSNNISGNENGVRFMANDYYNIAYLNDFIKNTYHVGGGGSFNFLNSSHKISYFYNNTNFTSQLGNYWDDYTGKDLNGDGIGETAYGSAPKDSFPLVKTKNNYLIIPPSIDVEMDAVYSRSNTTTVKIVAKSAIMNASISGELNGIINFTDINFVTIDSGKFKGKGFFTANWTATIEGLPYTGTWQGMQFKVSSTKTINLKGTLFGGLQGITDGYLRESTKNSGIFDQFNSSMTINQLGTGVLFAQPTLNGTVSYQKSINSTSKIYILQALFKGNCTGYYNKSLSVVLTHVRIDNTSHPYDGQGFSILTYISKLGAGLGWTYDKMVKTNITSLTGFFTKPLWGILFGTLDETGPAPTLSLTIIRLEVGLPPQAILDLNIWGPYIISPGLKFHYFMQFQNTGLVTVKNTEIIMVLPINCTYINNTGNGTYNKITHQVSWRQNISAKSKTLVSVYVNVSWGLKKGTKLYCNGSIHDYAQNLTLASYSYKRAVLLAKDPNLKYGPEGDVKPGQKLNYRIEFENVGQGIAYGVYFTDTLSEYLDDSTLWTHKVLSINDDSVIGSKGIYDPDTRTITWFVGELGPQKGGYTNFSINVHDDALPGSEILNYATIYFPSVPELTRTNGIVSIVRLNRNPIADAGSDIVAKTLEEILFDGSRSFDSDGHIMNYTWDFGDGGVGYGKFTSNVYQDNGDYIVKLRVTDDSGSTGIHEISVQVQNRLPVALLKTEQTEVNTNDEVTFNAEDSSDLDGSILEYYFDFGDGSNSGWINTPTTSHIYSDGTMEYTVKLNVKDDDGDINENNAKLEITVNNRVPIAELSVDLIEAFTYEDITFNAALSIDTDGDINSYYFDFGDEDNTGWITTSSVSHFYTDGTKEYTVNLMVKDDDGEIDTTELSIKIKNRSPEADAGSDQVVDTNKPIDFNGVGSSDRDGKLKSYKLDFGDGTLGTGKKTSHTYTENGQYTVTLVVMDDDGATGKDTCVITVNNIKPTAGFSIEPATGDINTIFKFSSTSYDTDGSIINFYWDFGDGETSDQVNPIHQYKIKDTYSISLVVQDNDGAMSDAFELEITLSNIPPVAVAQSSVTTAEVDEEIIFDASKSYDLDGKIFVLKWDFGDGIIAIGESVKHSYKEKGTYTVTLTVTDDYEQSASTTLTLIINEAIQDWDGDNIPDDIDTDDDNDGLPDEWENKYKLNTMDPSDAILDLDNDGLNNLEEFLINTDPTNPDTDNDGLNDKNDPYPTIPYIPKQNDQEDTPSNNIFLIAGIITILIVILVIGIITSLIVKNRSKRIPRPFDSSELISQLRDEIIQGESKSESELSDQKLWADLEQKYQNGEISEDTYRLLEKEKFQYESNLSKSEDEVNKI